MQKLKAFGLVVISLIVIAFVTTPQFFSGNTVLSLIQILVLLPLLVAAAMITLVELFFKKVPSTWFQKTIGVLFFIAGGSVFLFNKEYLIHGLSLPLSFWHQVSFYTLPAIVFESGVITLFSIFVPSNKFLSEREKEFLSSCLWVYAISVMVINFATILDFLSVNTHIFISKGIIVTFLVFVLVITITSFSKKTRK